MYNYVYVFLEYFPKHLFEIGPKLQITTESDCFLKFYYYLLLSLMLVLNPNEIVPLGLIYICGFALPIISVPRPPGGPTQT
jgi:hypothetical protein